MFVWIPFVFLVLALLTTLRGAFFNTHLMHARLMPEELKIDSSEVAPPVLPSPTNAQRQPMMPRSIRSVRSAVHGANWGPEVSNALATTISVRPATVPQRPVLGYQRQTGPVLEMNTDDLPCVPTLETPTNSQRQPMMSRSTRSVRTRITAADAETVQSFPPAAMSMTPTMATATLHAGNIRITPKPRGLKVASLETESLEGGTFQLSGMVTPTNLDRKNAQMSLQLGTPSFKGSATTQMLQTAPLQRAPLGNPT